MITHTLTITLTLHSHDHTPFSLEGTHHAYCLCDNSLLKIKITTSKYHCYVARATSRTVLMANISPLLLMYSPFDP
jgi:hypothetical protein